MLHTEYLHTALDYNLRKKKIDELCSSISASGISFDAIAFQGMSGSLIAPSVADRLGKGLIMIRKEHSHSSLKVEGCMEGDNYIILDDQIATGNTVRNIIKRLLLDTMFQNKKCVGIFLYSREWWTEVATMQLMVKDYVKKVQEEITYKSRLKDKLQWLSDNVADQTVESSSMLKIAAPSSPALLAGTPL
jgi:hypothetical protein